MNIGKQINVRGNGNVVAEHVQIYIGHDADQIKSRFALIPAFIAITVVIALGISLMSREVNPALAGSLFLAFLLSIAVLLKGSTANDGKTERRPDGYLQHDPERPPGQGPRGE